MAGRHRRRPGGGEGAPEKVGGLPCETLPGAPVRAELQSSAALHEQAPLEEFRLVNHQLFLSTGLLHGLRRGQGEGQRVLAGILRHRRGWWPWEGRIPGSGGAREGKRPRGRLLPCGPRR